MMPNFTETDTENYYNTVEIQHKIPWNPDGSKHWGYFEDLDAQNEEKVLFQACDRLNQYMLSHSQIEADSCVLDVGCGNGNTAIYLAQETQCKVVGLDISQIHIETAQATAKNYPTLRLAFHKGSATSLPFEDQTFSHVWSQGTLLHIHDSQLALQEAYRVLKLGGLFVFEDLVQLIDSVSESTLKYTYERLHVTELFNPQSYQDCLTEMGFQVLRAEDLSQHLKKSYDIQAQRVKGQNLERFIAYQKTSEAALAGEIGWWFYVCKKNN
jgi:ubiquinone/menaquinone biosynthesis C-methylase UbiE